MIIKLFVTHAKLTGKQKLRRKNQGLLKTIRITEKPGKRYIA
jgi:hypothetical protein